GSNTVSFSRAATSTAGDASSWVCQPSMAWLLVDGAEIPPRPKILAAGDFLVGMPLLIAQRGKATQPQLAPRTGGAPPTSQYRTTCGVPLPAAASASNKWLSAF